MRKDRRCTLWCNHHAQGRPVSVSEPMTLSNDAGRRLEASKRQLGNQGQYQILDYFSLSCMHSLPPPEAPTGGAAAASPGAAVATTDRSLLANVKAVAGVTAARTPGKTSSRLKIGFVATRSLIARAHLCHSPAPDAFRRVARRCAQLRLPVKPGTRLRAMDQRLLLRPPLLLLPLQLYGVVVWL